MSKTGELQSNNGRVLGQVLKKNTQRGNLWFDPVQSTRNDHGKFLTFTLAMDYRQKKCTVIVIQIDDTSMALNNND